MDENRYVSPNAREARSSRREIEEMTPNGVGAGVPFEQITKMSKESESDYLSAGVGEESERKLREE